MEMPKGFEKDGYVLQRRKGLYWLKEAAALCYDDAKATLAWQGLFPTILDACLDINK